MEATPQSPEDDVKMQQFDSRPCAMPSVPYSAISLPFLSSPSKSEHPKTVEIRRARRRLFTSTEQIQTDSSNTFVQEMLLDLANQHKEKWGFDFIKNQPIENNSSDIEYIKVSQKEVPGFYRASTYCFQNNADQHCSSKYEHKYSPQSSSSNSASIPNQDSSEVKNINSLGDETDHDKERTTQDSAELKARPKMTLKKMRKILETPIKKCQQSSIEKLMIPPRMTTSLFDDDHNKVDPTNSPTKRKKKSKNSIDIPSSTASANRASHQKRILQQKKRTSCLSFSKSTFFNLLG